MILNGLCLCVIVVNIIVCLVLIGFYTKFVTPDGDTALYLQTVRSAGHMVPQTQPKRSLELMRRFITGVYS